MTLFYTSAGLGAARKGSTEPPAGARSGREHAAVVSPDIASPDIALSCAVTKLAAPAV